MAKAPTTATSSPALVSLMLKEVVARALQAGYSCEVWPDLCQVTVRQELDSLA